MQPAARSCGPSRSFFARLPQVRFAAGDAAQLPGVQDDVRPAALVRRGGGAGRFAVAEQGAPARSALDTAGPGPSDSRAGPSPPARAHGTSAHQGRELVARPARRLAPSQARAAAPRPVARLHAPLALQASSGARGARSGAPTAGSIDSSRS